MIIKSLKLLNFRNYEMASFTFDGETNVLFGDNAQGKTNVLESLFVAGTTKSHKGSKDREMIQMGKNESHICMVVEKRGIDHKIDIHLKKNMAKGIATDGIPARKSGDFIGFVNIIFFSPEDLAIIKNGPAERRRFINIELCQLNKLYLSNLSKYKKALQQRNNLLKQIGFNHKLMDTLDVWDKQLETFGTEIIKERELFIKKLNEIIQKIHARLSGEKEQIEIKYEPGTTVERYGEDMFLAREKDLMFKTTGIGPHRDDISFTINGSDVRKYGSQGQQRTAALSLKLAEIEIVKQETGEQPILLLDDVLSELDRNRQNTLLESIKGIQTIITCTGLEEFVKSGMNVNKVFEIENGTIKSET